uniref:Uncharacterized protein n=1 Tax=Arundo donax TaxID=35708 RepID=A0A0A9B1G3_ARUDO
MMVSHLMLSLCRSHSGQLRVWAMWDWGISCTAA